MSESKEIEVWTTSHGDDAKAALPQLGRARYETTRVQISVLSKNLMEFLAEFQAVFQEPPSVSSGFHVDEIELNLGVNGSGGIALFGKLEVGVEAGIKIKLKRGKASLGD